ncbi:MAG TPA: transcriptional repressor [Acidimicrobiales bacterium]|nr:transcriptional repressor [Acidimicrobiales bacterium]
MPEILASSPGLAQGSAYRNVIALVELGVLGPIAGTDDHGRFELAQQLSGHHHHIVCVECRKVEDLHATPKLERALEEAARVAAGEQGCEITDRRLDLYGRGSACREHRPRGTHHAARSVAPAPPPAQVLPNVWRLPGSAIAIFGGVVAANQLADGLAAPRRAAGEERPSARSASASRG